MKSLLNKVKRHYTDGTLFDNIVKRVSRPFLLKPREIKDSDKSYSDSHLHKGEGYHKAFTHLPGRKMVWEFEQSILRDLIIEKGPFNVHLDFAGGTGRIAKIFEQYVKKQYLLDISEQMLSVAKNNLTKAELINRDFRDSVPEIENGSIDVATAFRFFPNAEQRLRSDAMAFLSRKMKKGGLLICNNHRNFWSIPYIASRITFQGGDVGMTNRQLRQIADENGLSLVSTYSIGVLPQSESHAIIPWRFVIPVEKYFYNISHTQQRLGYNILYLFKKY